MLPYSLSPHICIIASPDLNELLERSSLPPLPHILQSFSPLPQVTTRTTSLVSVPHASFSLRFSDLQEVEEACREDDDQRAIRTIDWMTARIGKRCAKWVQDMEAVGERDVIRTPWWDELRRCAEGDFVPAKSEGWNHPTAVILAVSTTAPNPLQAITALHSRSNQFPPWVDTNFLRYTLIIHPKNSPLSDEEAGALYNAVKKQFGLHSYLLSLDLPIPPPPPIPVPALMPRLPPPPSPESPQQQPVTPTTPNIPGSSTNQTILNTLRMEEKDIQQTARFTREFLVMSLIPWMEKYVVEWNENFSSTRRLPSRLFSSTRRLFGSQSSTPVHTPSASTHSLPGRSQSVSLNGGPAPPTQHRRLAEFATILGDLKVAIPVWEALRKEGRGGSDILPLLLAPSPAVPLHAQSALSSIHPDIADLPPHAQVRALLVAVRWENGIATQDFVGNAEEAPSALLLAQAALLSSKKSARRRAALWYVSAANRLEKCGNKPLTMYFLRKAQDLYSVPLPKELSPSFWDSEGKNPNAPDGLEDVRSGIAHPLGRLLYTTGDLAGAVKLFLTLLRGGTILSTNLGLPAPGDDAAKLPSNDKVYLDDFRVAYNYWKSTRPDGISNTNLQIPVKFCVRKQTRLRFPTESSDDNANFWTSRQEDWKMFWRSRGGKENVVPAGKASTNELFWVDLFLHNPLDTEVNLSNITLAVQELDPSGSAQVEDLVEVEVINDVVLGSKESVTVPVSLRVKRPARLSITHAKYDFLSLLPITESLACRGRRLHDTALQRQQRTYAPDVIMKVEVGPSDHRLLVNCIEGDRLVLLQGENKLIRLWLTNAGSKPIKEVWAVPGPDDDIWLGPEHDRKDLAPGPELLESSNSLLSSKPHRLSGADTSFTILPGESIEVSAILHAETTGHHELSILFVFREDETQPTFHSTRLTSPYEVQPLLGISVTAGPSQSEDYLFFLHLDVTNVSQTASIDIPQLTCLSPQWICRALEDHISCVVLMPLLPLLTLNASSSGNIGCAETLHFVSKKLSNLLKGLDISDLTPPSIGIHYSHISQDSAQRSLQSPAILKFIESGRRKFMLDSMTRLLPHISSSSLPAIFPLYNPFAVDLIVFWEIPSRGVSGHVTVHGTTLGATHGMLDGIIEEVESAKVKRSMYAETRRENMEVLDAIRNSDWNAEMNPVVLSSKDMGTQLHDFTNGPGRVSVEFRLRNHSLTHSAQYTLRLRSNGAQSSTNFLPPLYAGRMTFRGTIPPAGSTTVHPTLWIPRPGTYSLNQWTVETDVDKLDSPGTKWRRYSQDAAESETACLVVCDSRMS
ncbi:ER-golgi trafficking TRAPP I complex 85 kDa subunit-domain-containing protein [Gymnopilus junonius]|uniref:ER-golgi trafficking TRAPP I complex 85 kDa subunit-domain-containing protein n=1 Tax=Gymnopilus junonius TaxID=109634 RepID=A0A9P5TTQ8_GYMJU|nr:ER-golgi trafficking TRAPP I complex 85 kDa subunit-domain-containing protein [Gymnopilus junonius]